MQRLGRRDFLVLYAALVPLLLIAIFSLQNWEDLRSARSQGETGRKAFEQVAELLSTLMRAETAESGYLLTGESTYLTFYRKMHDRAEADVKSFHFDGQAVRVADCGMPPGAGSCCWTKPLTCVKTVISLARDCRCTEWTRRPGDVPYPDPAKFVLATDITARLRAERRCGAAKNVTA